MKLCVVLLTVVLVVVYVEAVLGDVEGGDPGSKTAEGGATTGPAERVCPPEASDHDKHLHFQHFDTDTNGKISILDKVVNLCAPCLEELQYKGFRNNSTTTEDHHRKFDGVCQRKPRFEECLSQKAGNLEACADPTLLKSFIIMREFLGRKFETLCGNNAERFVRLNSGTNKPDAIQLDKCTFNMYTAMKVIGLNEVDISSQLFILHKQIIELKECFSAVDLDTQVREEVDYLFGETIDTMQCIHPQDGSFVTCATLDPALVNFTSICDIKTQHNTLNLYDVLEHDAFQWFEGIFTEDNHGTDEEDITTDNEKLREDFKDFCSGIIIGKHFFNRVRTISQMCSNETVEHEVNLLVKNVKSALEHACTDEGIRLSDIMFEVYHLKRTSPDHSHAVLKCIEDAKLTRKDGDQHTSSSKNMRLYHELETFMECFINKIRGDQTSVDAATSVINEILGMVKCVNPEGGFTVLCASLMHDHSH